jgi:hypothetical protein
LQHSFPLDVPMVHSSALAISADGECLTCSGFSLSKTVRFGSLEFIADCFGGLSLSPRRNDSGAAFMGSTHTRPPSLLRAMIEDSTKEFYMTSSGEGASTSPLLGGSVQGGSVCSCHNHTMVGEFSGHSGHDDGSTVSSGTAVGH